MIISVMNQFPLQKENLTFFSILEQSRWLSASPDNKLIQDKTDLLLLTMGPNEKTLKSWIRDMKKQETIIANKHQNPQDVTVSCGINNETIVNTERGDNVMVTEPGCPQTNILNNYRLTIITLMI